MSLRLLFLPQHNILLHDPVYALQRMRVPEIMCSASRLTRKLRRGQTHPEEHSGVKWTKSGMDRGYQFLKSVYVCVLRALL